MANVLVNEDSLSDIADAIRAKNGTQTTYKPSQMADAISAISGGGVTPTGTKQISITSNGTITEDVSNYASAEITTDVQSTSGVVHYTGTIVSENGAKNTLAIPVDLTSATRYEVIVKLVKTGVVTNDEAVLDDTITIRTRQIISAIAISPYTLSWIGNGATKSGSFIRQKSLVYVNESTGASTTQSITDSQFVLSEGKSTFTNNGKDWKFNFAGYYTEFTYDVYVFDN